MDKNTKLEQLKESLANFEQKYKEVKGDMNGDEKMSKMAEYFYESIYQMRSYMYEMESNMYRTLERHTNPVGATHAPHLKTATQVEAYLEACNMDNDTEVVRPQIFVKANRSNNKEFEINLNIK